MYIRGGGVDWCRGMQAKKLPRLWRARSGMQNMGTLPSGSPVFLVSPKRQRIFGKIKSVCFIGSHRETYNSCKMRYVPFLILQNPSGPKHNNIQKHTAPNWQGKPCGWSGVTWRICSPPFLYGFLALLQQRNHHVYGKLLQGEVWAMGVGGYVPQMKEKEW